MALRFIKITDSRQPVAQIAGLIQAQLDQGETVLWLVPGGSAIKIAVDARNLLRGDLSRLTLSLTDERWGAPGYPDSNWRQLADAGFNFTGLALLPVLEGGDLKKTTELFARRLEDALATSDYALALMGLGPDGHIAGIKPGSPAMTETELVSGYEWQDFTRITITAAGVRRLDKLLIYAVGEQKLPALKAIGRAESSSPLKILEQAKDTIIYNDLIEEARS